MTFVNEKISKEDREKYGIDKIEHPNGSHWTQWTVDQERKSFLLSEGTDKERFHGFKFFYEGVLARIGAEETASGNPKDGIFITYDVRSFFLPESASSKQEEVIRAFFDAINEYGISGRRLPNCTITMMVFGKKLEVK